MRAEAQGQGLLGGQGADGLPRTIYVREALIATHLGQLITAALLGPEQTDSEAPTIPPVLTSQASLLRELELRISYDAADHTFSVDSSCALDGCDFSRIRPVWPWPGGSHGTVGRSRGGRSGSFRADSTAFDEPHHRSSINWTEVPIYRRTLGSAQWPH